MLDPNLRWLPPIVLLFPVLVIPWIILVNRRRSLTLIVIALVAGGVFDLVAYFIMLRIIPPLPSRYDVIKPFLLIQLGSGLSALVTTLVIRFCGFRMIREPRIQRQT